MNQLTIEHLAPYLPHELKFFPPSMGIRIIRQLSVRKIIDAFGADWLIESVKPVLRPLSDLTKEINHRGDVFVPVDYFLGDDVDIILNAVQINDLSWIPYNLIKKLYSWHFDISGLIPAGLAIDVNTLTENPYEKWTDKQNWIPVNELPSQSMKVRWLCDDGTEDIGFFYHDKGVFGTFDPLSEKPITHWKPLL